MQEVIDKGGKHSKTVEKLVGKFSTFMSKVKKEAPSSEPPIKYKSLKETLQEEYIELVQKQIKKEYDVKEVSKCFF